MSDKEKEASAQCGGGDGEGMEKNLEVKEGGKEDVSSSNPIPIAEFEKEGQLQSKEVMSEEQSSSESESGAESLTASEDDGGSVRKEEKQGSSGSKDEGETGNSDARKAVTYEKTTPENGKLEKYVVDINLMKRTVNGKAQYHFEWKEAGKKIWCGGESCWLTDPSKLIAVLEEKLQRRRKGKEPEAKKGSASSSASASESESEKLELKPTGFDRGLQPEKILDCSVALNGEGETTYSVKWEGLEELSTIPGSLAHEKCPQLVIEFYEELLIWQYGEEEEKVQDWGNWRKVKEDISFSGKKKKGLINDKEPAPSTSKPNGFERGLQPEKIISGDDSSGEFLLKMKWKKEKEPELVPARQANLECPQIVIAFYVKGFTRLNEEFYGDADEDWTDVPDESDSEDESDTDSSSDRDYYGGYYFKDDGEDADGEGE